MKYKNNFLLIIIIIFVSALGYACSNPSAVALPTQTAPTQVVPVHTVEPTQPVPVVTVTSAPEIFAPACAPCAAPAVTNTSSNGTYCTKKIPYQNFYVEPGAAFEPLDPLGGLKCTDSGVVKMVDGHALKVWSCTGKQLWTYELKVTSPSCSARMILEYDSNHCQAGFGYSVTQNCCAPRPGGDLQSVIVKVNMGACK